MKKLTFRRMLTVVLTVVFAVSLGGTGYKLFQFWQGDQVYSEAEELADIPDFTSELAEQLTNDSEPVPQADVSAVGEGDSSASDPLGEEKAEAPVYVDPYADALKNMDFAALREVNDDVLGWIFVPDTRISYPLLQGEDNDYYLKHTWRKYRNAVGAIFLEWQCSPDLSDFNTIIYGHRISNRSMFGILLKYKDISYWKKHPRVYITDDNGSHIYDIFAAYEAELDAPAYWLNVNQQSDKQEFIDYCLAQSVIDTGIVPTTNDQIVTLSTCTGNGHSTRWVVQGVRWGAAPETVPEKQEMTEEADVVEPVAGVEETPGEIEETAQGPVLEEQEVTEEADVAGPVSGVEQTPDGTGEAVGEELPAVEAEQGEDPGAEVPGLQEEPEPDGSAEEKTPEAQIEA